MELIVLLIKLLIKGLDKAGKGTPQERQRQEWQRQQAIEQWQREWAARQAAAGNAVALPPAVPLPGVPAARGAAGAVRRGPAKTPPPLPRSMARRLAPTPDAIARPQPTAAVVAKADAPAIARWMRPGSLRSQFIVTEILRPPLAEREPRL